MQLTPPDYRCDTHQQDLTELVKEQLEGIIVAQLARVNGNAFRVIVTCPGTAGEAGSAHDVACSGTRA